MEQDNCYVEQDEYWQRAIRSPEIVEISEDFESKSFASSTTRGSSNDVYVAVGKSDLNVLKWAIDHLVSPDSRVFLIHVYPPITHISTPVGRLSKSQIDQEHVRFYINEENNGRRNLLQKYIRLCLNAKISVETMLIESNATSKAIVDLIPILNISNLVMGTKRSPSSRWITKNKGSGEFVRNNAPDYCEVNIVYEDKKVEYGQHDAKVHSTNKVSNVEIPNNNRRRSSDRKFFECVCFSSGSN